MGILGPALALTKTVVRQFLADTGVRELITYRQWTSQTFSSTLKHNVDEYTETDNVRAIRLRAEDAVKMAGQLSLESGDVVFMVDFADLSDCSTKDQVVDADGTIFKITRAKPVFGIVWALICEGQAK